MWRACAESHNTKASRCQKIKKTSTLVSIPPPLSLARVQLHSLGCSTRSKQEAPRTRPPFKVDNSIKSLQTSRLSASSLLRDFVFFGGRQGFSSSPILKTFSFTRRNRNILAFLIFLFFLCFKVCTSTSHNIWFCWSATIVVDWDLAVNLLDRLYMWVV